MQGTPAQKDLQSEHARNGVKVYPDGIYGISIVVKHNPAITDAIELEIALVARESNFIDKETILIAMENALAALTEHPPDAIQFEIG